jgi:PAS domain S-box-containing protein
MLEADTVEQVKEQGLSAFIVDEYRTPFFDLFKAVINGKSGSLVFEAKGRRGTRRWLESHAIPFLNRENGENLMLAVTRDITQQKQAELDLLASEFRWKFAIEGSGDGLWDWNLQTNTVYLSNRWKEMLGFAEHEVNNHFDEWAKRVHPEDMAAAIHDIQEHQQGHTPAYKNAHRMLCKDGQWKWILARGMVVARDENGQALRMIGTHTDISEQRALQEALQDSLKEKLGLLNEVHHRVKNNLQVVTSLLRLESGRSDSPETKSVLNDMQARIRSMALLHESLYRTGIFASADLGAYLRELATHAFRAHISSAGIQLHVDVVSVNVTMDQATPCGLLVSELISNSLKHAFPDGLHGEIRLSLQPYGEAGQMRLCVSDNGQGMPEDFAKRCERSLGLRLVTDLAKQMRGELTVIHHPNAQFAVVFVSDLAKTSHSVLSPELRRRQEVLI